MPQSLRRKEGRNNFSASHLMYWPRKWQRDRIMRFDQVGIGRFTVDNPLCWEVSIQIFSIREVSIGKSAFKSSALGNQHSKFSIGKPAFKSALGNSALGKQHLGDRKITVLSHSRDSVMRGGAEEGRSNAQG